MTDAELLELARKHMPTGFTRDEVRSIFAMLRADIELHAPVSMQDCADIRGMVLDRCPAGTSVEVVLHGTPDRKRDGAHRVVVRVEDMSAELLVAD